MKRKIFLLIATVLTFSLTGCSIVSIDNNTEENVEFGEIDETREYIIDTDTLMPSLVERVEQINIFDNFSKIPINITQDIVEGSLPNNYGVNHNIHRVQLNNIFFDINEIAINNDYVAYTTRGFYEIVVPWEEDEIVVDLAQLSNENTYTLNDEATRLLNNIEQEYYETYEDSKHQNSGEYGGVCTYKKYVDFLNENPEYLKDINVYNEYQVLDLVFDVFDMEEEGYDKTKMLSTANYANMEYSDWYSAEFSYFSTKEGRNTCIVVKRNDKGLFAIKATYPKDCTIDRFTGEDYFTPTMIINFATNNYNQKSETYNDYVERMNMNR